MPVGWCRQGGGALGDGHQPDGFQVSAEGGCAIVAQYVGGSVLDSSGEFTFYVGGAGTPVRRVTATVGDVVPLAGGTPHTIRNESDTDAVAFVVHAPGASMENFSRAVAALAAGGEPRMEDVLAVAQRHGIELLGPTPAVASDPATATSRDQQRWSSGREQRQGACSCPVRGCRRLRRGRRSEDDGEFAEPA